MAKKIYKLTENDGYYIGKNRHHCKFIVVHCSANAEPYKPNGLKLDEITLGHILDWHKGGRGWWTVGYHYVIGTNGSIMKGRYDDQIGAHASPHNSNSIGVCYIGGCKFVKKGAKYDQEPYDTRTQHQKNALLLLLYLLKRKFPSAQIIGHRDVAQKACPSYDAKSEYAWISRGEQPSGYSMNIFNSMGIDPSKPYSIDVLDYGVHTTNQSESLQAAARRLNLDIYSKSSKQALIADNQLFNVSGSGVDKWSMANSDASNNFNSINSSPKIQVASNQNKYFDPSNTTSNTSYIHTGSKYIDFSIDPSQMNKSDMFITNLRNL